MRHLPKFIAAILIIFFAGTAAYFASGLLIKPQRSVLVNAQPVEKSNSKTAVNLVALGDSLTEGVGDTTSRGGFVPLVATEIKDKFSLDEVSTDNFGKSGDRSDQILKRLKASEKQQEALKSADVITVTVGGNDLMQIVSKNLFNGLTLKTFTKPASAYQRKLTSLITEVRKYATDAPIYIFGIYNPFYLYFPEITELQDIVDFWNEKTEDLTLEQADCYFIPINDLLYKGTTGTPAVEDETNTTDSATMNDATRESTESSSSTETTGSTTDSTENSSTSASSSNENTSSTGGTSGTTTSSSATDEDVANAIAGLISTTGNDLIFDDDHFHPNNLGYQKMAGALRDELIQTQGLWLKDERK